MAVGDLGYADWVLVVSLGYNYVVMVLNPFLFSNEIGFI